MTSPLSYEIVSVKRAQGANPHEYLSLGVRFESGIEVQVFATDRPEPQAIPLGWLRTTVDGWTITTMEANDRAERYCMRFVRDNAQAFRDFAVAIIEDEAANAPIVK